MRLGPEELRILECRQPDEAVEQRLRELRLLEIELVRKRKDQRCRHWSAQLFRQGRRRFPRFCLILFRDERHIERMDAAGGAENYALDIATVHGLDRCQACPLVGIGSKIVIDKYAATPLARLLLQGQGDQVAEAALGKHVLVGKEPVVGRQFELPGSGTGVADDRRAQPPCVAGGHSRGEENPRVRAVARARNFERHRDFQFPAGLTEGTRIFAPALLIEINGEKVAGAVGHQRIETHRVSACEVCVDDLIVQRQQQPVVAV